MTETTQSVPDDQERVSARSNPRGPGLERAITLTDAVVAIAMTLLVLPLVDLVDADNPFTLAELWRDNSALFVSFVVSFVVIWIFWTAHGSVYQRLAAAGLSHVTGLSLVNVCWLLMIAFLPFSTVLVGRKVTTGTAPVYLGTMLVLSALTYVMNVLVQRSGGEARPRAWLSTAVIGLCTAVSFVDARLGMYLLLLLVVCGRVERRIAAREGAPLAASRPSTKHEQ